MKYAALVAYSSKHPECACCGLDQWQFLTIDHVNGGGNQHRKSMGVTSIFRWLKANNYPPGFQVLCHNCNLAKYIYGQCPHVTGVATGPP